MIHLIFEDIIVRWVISVDSINWRRTSIYRTSSRILSIASRSAIRDSSSSHSLSHLTRRRSMSQNRSIENFFSKTIVLARQLKTLSNTDLHKRRIKSNVRNILENICRLCSNENLSQFIKETKDKIRATKALKDQQSFSFDWVVDASLVSAAIKALLVEIKNLRDYFFAIVEKSSTSFTTHLSQSSHQIFIQETLSIKEQRKSLENLDDVVDSFELFTHVEELKISKSSRESESLLSKDRIAEQEKIFNESKLLDSQRISSELLSSFNRANDVTQSERVHSTIQLSRVQSDDNLFHTSHLKNLRDLFITQHSLSSTYISVDSESTKTALSEKYFEDVSSTVFRQFNYRSLQDFVQRNINLNFLKSILSRSQSKLITKQSTDSAFTSSKHQIFDSNKKELNENLITRRSNKREIVSLFFLTTSTFEKQINSFLSSSTLSFNSLFHQFRSSFSSNSFTFSFKSVFFSRLSAELNHNLNSSRVQKLNDCTIENISSEVSSSFVTIDTHSTNTNIISSMSTLERNLLSHSVSNLTQQNIQDIVLSMFNLFAQNVQSQTQTKAVETTADVVTVAKKSSFRASDVRFFDSQLNSSYDSDDVVQMRRDLYYRDVYFFVERIKNAVIMSGAETVRTNLSTCLRGSTQVWYIEGLSDLEKKTLRTFEEEIDHWCNVLFKKFKKSIASTLNYLTTERYTFDDVRANRDIFSFVFQIMRHVKTINIVDLHEQLTWAYNAIASKLARDIDFSDENTTTMTFLKNLKIKKNTWHRIYSRKLNSSRIESEFSSYQVNFSNSSYLAYDQSTYSQRQYSQKQFQLFESDNDSRNQRFQQNDNVYQKSKTSVRAHENHDEFNQQNRFSIVTTNQTQSSSFGIQSMRNQTISAWRQNVSHENISKNSQFATNANITTRSRSLLTQYNIEERQYQDQEKRDQFRKFYENKSQLMQAYVEEKHQNDEEQNNADVNSNHEKLFEDIDFVEKNDENDHDDQFVYNLSINTSDICKKCEQKREIFRFNNAFHVHIRECIEKETKLNNLSFESSENLLIIKSIVDDTIQKDYDFRSY